MSYTEKFFQETTLRTNHKKNLRSATIEYFLREVSQFDFLKRKKSYDYPESHKTQVTIYAEGLTKNGFEKYLIQKQPNEFGISIFNKNGKEIEYISNVTATKTYESSLEYFNKL